MFRSMRRSRQQLTDSEAIDILCRRHTAVLALSGDDGYPYAVPVNYAYADGRIYFHGAKTGHKLDAIRRCDKVSLCVIDHDELVSEELTTYFRSVIVFGRARILEDEEAVHHAALVFGLKYNEDEMKVEAEIKREAPALACVEITPEHITGKEAIELVRRRQQ